MSFRKILYSNIENYLPKREVKASVDIDACNIDDILITLVSIRIIEKRTVHVRYVPYVMRAEIKEIKNALVIFDLLKDTTMNHSCKNNLIIIFSDLIWLHCHISVTSYQFFRIHNCNCIRCRKYIGPTKILKRNSSLSKSPLPYIFKALICLRHSIKMTKMMETGKILPHPPKKKKLGAH